jgi:transcriptional regulator with XRE-family HTH domain
MKDIHSRIRTLRRLQNRTLKDIADSCGFTVSLLSKIESGKTTPPIATLQKIADALGVGLSDLLDSKNQKSSVLTKGQILHVQSPTITDKGYGFHVLASERNEKMMQPFLFVAEQGAIKPGPMSHSGEEFIYVLDGRMNYRVGDVTYTLGPGDSLYFDAEEDHDLEPITPTVRYLGLFTARPSSRDSRD